MTLNDILRKALLGGIFLIPFIPLVVVDTFFFPFITGKNFIFRILVELIFALWLLLALRDPAYRPKWSMLPIVLLAFLASAGLSAFLAENPVKAFWSNFERMEGWIALLHSTAYFFVAYLALNSAKLWDRFWSVSLGASAAIGIYGFLQLAGVFAINQGGIRVDGTFGNATYLAVYMLFHAFIALWYIARSEADKEQFKFSYWAFAGIQSLMLLFVQVQNPAGTGTESLILSIFRSWEAFLAIALPHLAVWLLPLAAPLSSLFAFLTRPRVWFIITGILSVAMIYFAATRGTILGFIGGILLLGILLLVFGKGNASLRKWGVGAAIAVVVIAGAFFAVKDAAFVRENPVLERIASISLETGETRFTIWGMAFEGFKERPLFGWGQEGFNFIFNKYYEPSLYGQEPWFDRAHNAFIDWLVAGGIVGFLLYTSLYALGLWYVWRRESTFSVFEKSLFTGLLAAYAFHNLFVFDNLISYVFFMTVLAYILSRSGSDTTPSGAAVSEGVFMVAAPVVVLLMAGFMFFANASGLATSTNLIQGVSPQCVNATGISVPCNSTGAVRDITKNFEFFKAANTATGLGRQEAREQTLQFAAQIRTLQAGDAAFHDEVASFAVAQMTDEIQKTPNDTRLHTFLGSFWRQIGNPDEALKSLRKASELSPNKQQILFEIAILENDRGNYTAALEAFKTAFELAPEYDMARVFYAVTAIRAGQKSLGEGLLMERFGTVTPDNDYVLQAYLDSKDFVKALIIAEGRVTADPQNAERRVQLAAAYLATGDRARAIASLEQAIEMEPSFKAQGTYFINEIRAGRNP